MKNAAKTLLPLLIICVVAAVCLGFFNQLTEEPIRQNTLKAQNATRYALFPDASDFHEVETDELKSDCEVLDASGTVIGHVLESAANGFGGEIVVTVGLDNQNLLTGISVGGENFSETAGLGALAKEAEFTDQFAGKQPPLELSDIDAISGATITSKAVLKAVNNAYNAAAGAVVTEVSRAAGTPENEDGWLGIADSAIGGELQVRVKLENDTITAVKVVSHNETAGISDAAIEKIPEAIVAANSTDVDTVAGATRTSEAIIEAVKDALLNAANPNAAPADETAREESSEKEESSSGETTAYAGVANSAIGGPVAVAVVKCGDTITSVTVLSHNETAGISDAAIEEIPKAIVAANSADVDTVAGATRTSEAIIEAVKNALASDDNGETGEVFTGSAKSAIGGELTVSVTLTDGVITDVQVVSHNETAGISDPAIQKIPAAIVEANSTDVDTVSGATYTSKAIIEAVKNALAGDESQSDAPAAEEKPDTASSATETAATAAPKATEKPDAASSATEAAAAAPVAVKATEAPVAPVETENGWILTGSAKSAIGGKLTVSVTLTDGVITDVQVVSHNETAGISDPAIQKIPAAIVEANSADVDTVSGATLTSKAIIEAVKNALASMQ